MHLTTMLQVVLPLELEDDAAVLACLVLQALLMRQVLLVALFLKLQLLFVAGHDRGIEWYWMLGPKERDDYTRNLVTYGCH